jgi:predicted flap endonuclease-1-like 5' DNA nuclease/chromosome segregation ATPase
MSYLISNIVFALASTFFVGLLFGWFIWGRLKNKLAALEVDWRNRYLRLDSEYQSVVTKFSELELELNDKTSRISKLNEDKNEIAIKLNTAKSVEHETDKEIEQLKNQLGQITARCHVASKALDERNEELQALQQSPDEISELKSLLGKATQRYNNNGLELKNKSEELIALQNSYDETSKRTALLSNELSHLRAQLLKRDKEFENQVVSFTKLQNELKDNNKMLSIVQTELDSRKSNSNVEAELKDRDAKISSLQQALKIERERIPAIESQQAELLDAKKHIPALNNEISSLRDRIPALEGSLKQRDSSISALEGEIARVVNELTPLRDNLDQRDTQMHELKQEVHTLQQRIPAFKSTISARDAHIRELEILINDAQKALLKPAKLAITTNGNGKSNENGAHKNGSAKTSGANTNGNGNGNVIQINSNAATNGNCAAHKNDVVKTNGSATASSTKNRAGNNTQKRKIKPYGLKKPNRKPDDLKLIAGIGETLEKTLHECGIFYFEQIAGFSRKDVSAVDDLLNFKRRVDRDDWINQARKLMNGNSSSDKNTVSASKKAPKKSSPKSTPLKRAIKALGMKRPAGKLDDLQLINGVGPTLEKKLHRLGIYHYEQIAQLTAEDIKLIDSKLKTYKGRVKRDKWPMQARRLHKEFHVRQQSA